MPSPETARLAAVPPGVVLVDEPLVQRRPGRAWVGEPSVDVVVVDEGEERRRSFEGGSDVDELGRLTGCASRGHEPVRAEQGPQALTASKHRTG